MEGRLTDLETHTPETIGCTDSQKLKRSNQAKKRLYERFIRHRRETKGKEESEGLTLTDLNLFLTHLVIERKGSTRSIMNNLSHLKTFWIHNRKDQWLSHIQHTKARELLSHYCWQDMSEANRKLPLTIDIIQRIESKMSLEKSDDLLLQLLLWLGNQSLSRGAELCSSIKMEQIRFLINGFELTLFRTKTNRSKGFVRIRIPDNQGQSACKLLKAWIPLRNLIASSAELLFPKKVTVRWLSERIKTAVNSIGLDASRFANHSLRAGGATDLFVAGVPYYVVKRMGRWKSDAAMIYYRDEDDVADKVKAGRELLGRRSID